MRIGLEYIIFVSYNVYYKSLLIILVINSLKRVTFSQLILIFYNFKLIY